MISYQEFLKGCKRLVESGFTPGGASSGDTTWYWWVPEGEGDPNLNSFYAVIKCICRVHFTCCPRHSSDEASGSRDEDDGCCDCKKTAAAAAGHGLESSKERMEAGRVDSSQRDAEMLDRYAVIEFHICYSASYQEPVLYIHAYLDSGTVLGMQDVRQNCLQVLLPSYNNNDGSKKTSRDIEWPTLTQESHPVTQVPCYMVHPCDTRDVMEGMLQGGGAEGHAGPSSQTKETDMHGDYGMRYIVAWLSIVGQPFGIVPTVKDMKQYVLDRLDIYR